MKKALEDILKRSTKIGFFGLGKSNEGVLEYLRGKNYKFSLTLRSDTEISGADLAFAERIFTKSRSCDEIDEYILFLSPSIRRDRPELQAAANRGTLLFSDTELFFALNKRPVYALTGSDGKSTTTYLLAKMLTECGEAAMPCGNYGVSPALLIEKKDLLPVTELSSFQLMYLRPKSHRAIITNITPNHLNWHKNFDEYVNAKLNIAENTDGLVLDIDCDEAKKAAARSPLFCAVSQKDAFGDLKKKAHAEHYITIKSDGIYLDGEFYFTLSEARRKEEYNIKNIMLAAGAISDISKREAIEKAIKGFRGLPHRSELSAERNGIKYVNSSIDSTPARTLQTLSALKGNIAIIIGGAGKGLSLDDFAQKLPKLTVGACLMGKLGDELFEILKEHSPDYRMKKVSDMEEAIAECEKMLPCGGTLILSPAATSYDKYKNFEDRGNHFKSILENKYKEFKK